MSMMRNGKPPVTQREKAAARELYNLAKESHDLLVADEPRDAERLKEITARGRILLPMVGWEDIADEM